MQIKDMFNNYFSDFDNKLDDVCKMYRNQISSNVSKFKENTKDQIDDVVSRRELRDFNKVLDNNIIEPLERDLKEINNVTTDVIKEITSKVTEAVLFNITNPTFNINKCSTITDEYKIKIKEINILNKQFVNKFNDYFDLFLYYLSIDEVLRKDVVAYKIIKNVIKQNKNILLDNVKSSIEERKKETINAFNNYIIAFIEDANELKKDISIKNNMLLVDYSRDLLKNNIIVSTNDTLKNNCKLIDNVLTDTHNQIIKLQKSKKTKEKDKIISYLNNELVTFNNTLFDKCLNTLLKISSNIECDSKELEKTTAKYNEAIYKICDFEYNFDRQFLNYQKEMLNKKYFISNKLEEKVIHVIEESKEEIINIIKFSVIDLFKTNIALLNTITYKTIMTKYKLKNYSELINNRLIEKLFV